MKSLCFLISLLLGLSQAIILLGLDDTYDDPNTSQTRVRYIHKVLGSDNNKLNNEKNILIIPVSSIKAYWST